MEDDFSLRYVRIYPGVNSRNETIPKRKNSIVYNEKRLSTLSLSFYKITTTNMATKWNFKCLIISLKRLMISITYIPGLLVVLKYVLISCGDGTEESDKLRKDVN